MIKILEAANKDIVAGFNFYEKQYAGLGTYFLDSIFSDIDSLSIYAGIHTVYFDKYYRMLSKRFPFAIYYRIQEEDIIVVYAILDCRQAPAWSHDRLS